MKIRKMVISAVLVVIGLPVALVLIAVASISVLDPSNGSIVPSGEKRQYLLYVPESYDRAKPTPLVTDATGGRDIRLGGGVSTIRQYFARQSLTSCTWPSRPSCSVVGNICCTASMCVCW